MRVFERAIYPIWKSIFEKRKALDEKETDREKFISDFQIIHKCDIAIKKSGHRPDRVVVGQKEMEIMRKKAVVGEKYAQAKGEWGNI